MSTFEISGKILARVRARARIPVNYPCEIIISRDDGGRPSVITDVMLKFLNEHAGRTIHEARSDLYLDLIWIPPPSLEDALSCPAASRRATGHARERVEIARGIPLLIQNSRQPVRARARLLNKDNLPPKDSRAPCPFPPRRHPKLREPVLSRARSIN